MLGGIGLQWVFIGIFIILGAWLIAVLIRRAARDYERRGRASSSRAYTQEEFDAEIVAEPDAWIAQARKYADAGDYRRAFRAVFLAVIRQLDLAGAVHYGAVRQQNEKLTQEIDALKMQVASQSDAEQMLKQLSALQNLPFVGNLETVPAEVTDFSTSDFAATIDISVGRADGVQLNMPVVGSGGLVGQVVEANHSTATVRLITDGQSEVGVSYGPGVNQLAVVSGHGAGKPLTAGLVPTNTHLSVGQVFVTSGLPNAEFPGDIPVATVVATSNGVTASQETVTLQPLADLSHLRYVSVLLYGPST